MVCLQGISYSLCHIQISPWWDTLALERIQGNHLALGVILAFVCTVVKPSVIWISLPCPPSTIGYRPLSFSKSPQKDFLKPILSPKYFITYCSFEQEMRFRSFIWVLVIHLQTSICFQRLNSMSLSVCKHVGSASTEEPRPLKQSQFEKGFLGSGVLFGIFFFFFLSLLSCCILFGSARERIHRRTSGRYNQEKKWLGWVRATIILTHVNISGDECFVWRLELFLSSNRK